MLNEKLSTISNVNSLPASFRHTIWANKQTNMLSLTRMLDWMLMKLHAKEVTISSAVPQSFFKAFSENALTPLTISMCNVFMVVFFLVVLSAHLFCLCIVSFMLLLPVLLVLFLLNVSLFICELVRILDCTTAIALATKWRYF